MTDLDWHDTCLDPYRDPEIDEWAARKIQSSFKQYKRQKSGLSPRREETPSPIDMGEETS